MAKLTAAHHESIRATADAELRGDPVEALRHFESVPMFRESLHHGRLRQLAELGDQAPAWWWSRWLTVQARRGLWTRSVVARPDPALQETLVAAYPHGLEPEVMEREGFSPEMFLATMYERDWVLRQLLVYEHGGLRELVEQRASSRFLERAETVDQWPQAPMGGFRFDSDDGELLQLTDLADGRRVEVLDLGLGVEHWPGDHVIGRLAPISEAPGRMFEWRPLGVDAATAKGVADLPDGWLSTIAARARDGSLPTMFSYLEDTSMVQDLPVRTWIGLLDPEEISELPGPDGLIDYDDVALVVLGKVLRAVGRERAEIALTRHFMETLLLEPGLLPQIRLRFGGPGHRLAWAAVASVVREPARARCLSLAEGECTDVA